jgi:hypothetical protein
LVPLFDECFFLLIPLLRARCGEVLSAIEAAGPKFGSPRFGYLRNVMPP